MRAAAPVACVAQPMGEWVERVVAVQNDRACELTVTVVTAGVRRVGRRRRRGAATGRAPHTSRACGGVGGPYAACTRRESALRRSRRTAMAATPV